MSFTNATLSAIQQAGAAVHAAEAALKEATQGYAVQVAGALQANPYALGNDTLFDHWKLVARLAQAMAGMEQELQKVYYLGVDLLDESSAGTVAVPALAAPVVLADTAHDLAPTDVRVKTRKTAARTQAPSRARARVARPAAPKASGIGSNATRLLAHLAGVLSAGAFVTVSQTDCARVTGIPMGSMSAALKQLQASGQLVAGPAGGFKLGQVR